MDGYLRNSVCATMLAVCALAMAATGARADIQTLRDSDNAIWASFGTSLLNYQEFLPPDSLSDSEHGWTPSFGIGGSMLIPNEARGWTHNLYMAIEASSAFGNATYNGAYLATPTVPLSQSTSELVWTVDGKLGKAFPLNKYVMLIPYGEIGYRYWGRGTDSENYDNWDALAGVMLQVSPIDRLILSAYGSAGTTFAANMDTGSFSFPLGSAAMYKIGGKVGVDITRQFEIFTTLDYDAFRYVQSTVNSSGFEEPSSKTEDTTMRVGVSYHFR